MKLSTLCMLIALNLTVIGCSLYQSEGREFLEEQAFDFALQGASFQATQKQGRCAEVAGLTLDFVQEHWQFKENLPNAGISMWQLTDTEEQSGILLLLQSSDKLDIVCEQLYDNPDHFHQQFERDLELSIEVMLRFEQSSSSALNNR